MPAEERFWNISEVNAAVRTVLEGAFAPFWLEAEIGTMTVHQSGHVYLALKDSSSQLKAVLWRGAAQVRELGLRTGDMIEAFGNLTAYETRGEYQFNIKTLRPGGGQGLLQRRFEELKAKLAAEGLFDPARKRPIPMLPRTIGVVSSADGAAVRDFLNIVKRRFPDMRVRIYPAAVQGKGAERQVAAGVRFFNRPDVRADVIVVTRGGGSMEDLWPFNEELLAREVAASAVPVISAVGHEVDFTICDFVADLRVPTPSAAAELVVGAQEELKESLARARRRLRNALKLKLANLRRGYERLGASAMFKAPERLVQVRQQRLDELLTGLVSSAKLRLERSRNRLGPPTQLSHGAKLRLERARNRLGRLQATMLALDPKGVLKRGYSILVERGSGKVVDSPDLPPGSPLDALMEKGVLHVVVEEIRSPEFGVRS